MTKFVFHKELRKVGVVVSEEDNNLTVWFGGTLNRKPVTVIYPKNKFTEIHKLHKLDFGA